MLKHSKNILKLCRHTLRSGYTAFAASNSTASMAATTTASNTFYRPPRAPYQQPSLSPFEDDLSIPGLSTAPSSPIHKNPKITDLKDYSDSLATPLHDFNEIHSATPLGRIITEPHHPTLFPSESIANHNISIPTGTSIVVDETPAVATNNPVPAPTSEELGSAEETFEKSENLDDFPVTLEFACSGQPYHYPRPSSTPESTHKYFENIIQSLPKRVEHDLKLTYLDEQDYQAFNSLSVNDTLVSMGCGEDSLIGTHQLLGLADGVSGWTDMSGGHASLWSRLILHHILDHYVSDKSLALPPLAGSDEGGPCLKRILDKAFESTKSDISELHETGSSTLVLARLRPDLKLDILCIGDSSIYIIRDGTEIVFTNNKTETPTTAHVAAPAVVTDNTTTDTELTASTTTEAESKHDLDDEELIKEVVNCPQQVGTNTTVAPSSYAQLYQVTVEPNDVIMLCSDGISDNLWQNEITEVIAQEHLDLKQKADMLVHNANDKAFDNFAVCPYQLRSPRSTGGKTDDMTVLLATVKV
ncbi:hypothetical protein D0Z00_002394 [Geotrichum galactomycetum]|uniref:Uncharacterized protein n=1 Tax=Geotrichum galactomycetum TaxID=27317 RepID=A0ACB6V4H4_9ASCO|nr:hypothetical protein D0Z00_002394 [Geotrichum candidum]